MQFVEHFDTVYFSEEEQYEDSDRRMDKAELMHSNSCLRILYTDLQENVEMTEDSNMLLRTENRELKSQVKSLRQSLQNLQPIVDDLEDIQAAKREKDQIFEEVEAKRKEFEQENKMLRQQIEALSSETLSLIMEREQQETEMSELSCVLKALQQQHEEQRLHLEQKDELINQMDVTIKYLRESVSEYITINQDLKEKIKDLEEQLVLAIVNSEGNFMDVDTTETFAPEHAVSLQEELGILYEDQMNHEEVENTETVEEQAALYVSESFSERCKRNLMKGAFIAVGLCFMLLGVFGDTIKSWIKPYSRVHHTAPPPV